LAEHADRINSGLRDVDREPERELADAEAPDA
jgi:hypothetical protein